MHEAQSLKLFTNHAGERATQRKLWPTIHRIQQTLRNGRQLDGNFMVTKRPITNEKGSIVKVFSEDLTFVISSNFAVVVTVYKTSTSFIDWRKSEKGKARIRKSFHKGSKRKMPA